MAEHPLVRKAYWRPEGVGGVTGDCTVDSREKALCFHGDYEAINRYSVQCRAGAAQSIIKTGA